MTRALVVALVGSIAVATAGCGSSDEGRTDEAPDAGGDAGRVPEDHAGPVPLAEVTCSTPPPPGAAEPTPPRGYSGGACPTFQAVSPTCTLPDCTNTLASGGTDRHFLLVVPSDHAEGQALPVAFLWHWLGGDASQFLSIASLQAVVDELGFIAVIPEKKGDVLFTWPATVLESEDRFQEELGFFDDMLSCVAAQYDVNLNCVSSVGVSAGALWTDQLAWARSEFLSSVLSLSGGVGDITHAWGEAGHALPALVVWGGAGDRFDIGIGFADFQVLSRGFEEKLTAGGHFVTECVHNCGHGLPPLEGPPGSNPIEGMVEGLVRFALDHPYWLEPGESPWEENGLPAGLPDFCGIGAGNAVPRTGDCTGAIGVNNPPAP